MVDGAPDTDLVACLEAGQHTLQAQLGDRASILEIVRAANQSTDPHQVADWLVRQMQGLFPGLLWATVTSGPQAPSILGHSQLAASTEALMIPIARWVFKHGVEFGSANLANDARLPGAPSGAAVAFPLEVRAGVVGALIGISGLPTSRTPGLDRDSLSALSGLLVPAAAALNAALELAHAEELSMTDDLTGLFNSRHLDRVLDIEVRRSTRYKRSLSLLILMASRA